MRAKLLLSILSLYFVKNQDFCVALQEESLVLVHVLFRHGNRTPNGPEELYPKDPYLNEAYYPFGIGQLTKAGERKEYAIGRALRQRFDKFLGPDYYPPIVDSWSTDYNRTKASLALVLAGLFPPHNEELWNNVLPWQPIPYNYLPQSQDKILLGTICPYFEKLYDAQIEKLHKQGRFQKFQNVFKYISQNSGLNVTQFRDAYNLFFGLKAEEDWGFVLPNWTKRIFPQPLINLGIQEYFTQTATTELRRMASGYFLQKLLSDTYSKIKNNSQRKIYLYSAHENNIADLLILLDVFQPPHIPDYGSYIIFEVHRINGAYGIKIFYQNYTSNQPKLLKIPACGELCELSKFSQLIEEYIPDEDLCYKK